MRAPENTAAASPLENLVVTMEKNGIENQEAQGQRQLVNSDTLPTAGLQQLRQIPGLQILEPVEGDPLFTYVKLPDGWSKRSTSHSMHSDLLDERGRKRAGIFYKAAFYDRRADIRPDRRFWVEDDYARKDATGEIVSHVKDAGEIVFSTTPRTVPDGEKYWDVMDAANAEAKAWLVERRPDWENAFAYWDEA